MCVAAFARVEHVLFYSCVHVLPCDSVCALFKPTVSRALQGSLCIIGDLLLSAHCIWQIWIGDCQADMLINDNHNWYLLIARDEKPGTAERMTNAHTLFAHVCDYRVGVWLCVISVSARSSHFLTPGWSHSNQPMVYPAVLQWCYVPCVRFHVYEPVGGASWVCREMECNVCDLAHIWSCALLEGEKSYISTQHTHSNRSTHR